MAKPRSVFRANALADLHEEGARRFGADWLTANRHVLNIARNYRLSSTVLAPFLSDMAFEICEERDRSRVAASGSVPHG